MKSIVLFSIISLVVLTGCEKVSSPDLVTPSSPTGLHTETGDNFIELFWNANPESDVAGYNVYASDSYNGRHELVGSTRSPFFRHTGLENGTTYYYAVTAYNFDGNESELSKDVAYDIPRPEGYGVILNSVHLVPASAGYDFSDYRVLAYNDLYADMYFDFFNGEYYMNVRTDSDIQDVGPTNSLLEIRQSPTTGWSTTHDVTLRVGHTYVVWTWDNHYAKFRVTSLSSSRVVLDWAYQTQVSNPMLRPAGHGGGVRQVGPAVER